jgi:hypothetical protein
MFRKQTLEPEHVCLCLQQTSAKGWMRLEQNVLRICMRKLTEKLRKINKFKKNCEIF